MIGEVNHVMLKSEEWNECIANKWLMIGVGTTDE